MPFRIEPDPVVARFVCQYSAYLDRLLAAPPTPEELAAEERFEYLEDEAWERIYFGKRQPHILKPGSSPYTDKIKSLG